MPVHSSFLATLPCLAPAIDRPMPLQPGLFDEPAAFRQFLRLVTKFPSSLLQGIPLCVNMIPSRFTRHNAQGWSGLALPNRTGQPISRPHPACLTIVPRIIAYRLRPSVEFCFRPPAKRVHLCGREKSSCHLSVVHYLGCVVRFAQDRRLTSRLSDARCIPAFKQ